jgi:hypothetical protein
VTGEDGACELVGLADLPYSVAAYLEGFSFRGETETARVQSGAEVRFRAADRARVELTVLLPDGTEPVVALLSVSGKMGTGQRRWTPGRRDAWVPPDTWTITATAGESNEFRSSPVDVAVPPEGLSDPVTIRLDPRTGIRGRVVLPEGDLGASGKIRAVRLLEGEDADTERLTDPGHGQDVKVARGGSFVVLDLAPGTWVLGLVTGSEAVGRTAVQVSQGLAECEIVMPDADPEGSVIVTVLDPEGNRDDRVSVVGEMIVGEQRTTGPRGVPLRDGGFRVVHALPREGALGEVRYVLVVRSRLYGESRVPYGGPGERHVEVRLEKPASLTVRVTGYTASGHAGHVKLILVPPAGRGGGPYWQTDRPPDEQGVYRLPHVTPGDYRLVVQAMLDKTTRIPAGVHDVMVAPGDNSIEVAMPRLHSLAIVSGTANARFGLRPPLESGQRWRCAPRSPRGGRVVWEHLPAGEYRIEPQGPARRAIRVSVPGTREVEYDPRPDNCLLVRITDPAGVFARAGLEDGDVIVAIDGTELTDSRQMQALGTLAMKKREAEVTVLRGGRRVEVRANLSDWQAWGGRLEHARR